MVTGELAQTDPAAPGTMAVDWEQRVDFPRLRAYKELGGHQPVLTGVL